MLKRFIARILYSIMEEYLLEKHMAELPPNCGKNVTVEVNSVFRNKENITLGNNVTIESNCLLQTWPIYNNKATNLPPKLYIASNVSIMSGSQISCMNEVTIGEGCLLGNNVFITDNFHGKTTEEDMKLSPIKRDLFSKGAVVLGKNVWVGRNVCIMPCVHIGDGAVIGANSVVTSDVPAYSVVAGCPAKIVKQC